ncbi:MAG: hypothetical protein AB7E15_06900 [Azospira sp.]|jgi:hypothetical protein
MSNNSFLAGMQLGQQSANGFNQGVAAGERLYADQKRLEAEAAFRAEILDLKQQVEGYRSVKDTLKKALAEVAPNHPLVTPAVGNPVLGDAYDEGAARVKQWDAKI